MWLEWVAEHAARSQQGVRRVLVDQLYSLSTRTVSGRRIASFGAAGANTGLSLDRPDIPESGFLQLLDRWDTCAVSLSVDGSDPTNDGTILTEMRYRLPALPVQEFIADYSLLRS